MQKTISLAVILCMLLPGAGIFAQTTDVYFVGNSFTSTYDVPSVFKALSASGGHAVQTGSDIIGGSELAEHWATGKAANDIAAGSYDYVVLQEGSSVAYTPAIESNFNIYAPLYDSVITNSGAQTILYMTWVREDHLSALTNGIAIYRDMAEQLGCKVSPVGEAWRRVMLQAPALDLFGPDRHHPNQKGAYLSACNFYGTIFNESPEGLSMRTVGGMTLDAAEAALLQRIAWDAVQFVSYTNPPVISSMTVDQAVRTNSTPFTFQAAASDNGSITDYLWDFGDGTTTNGSALTEVTHDYATDGIFPVTVKVTDNSGETERTGLYVTRDTTGPQVSDIAVTRTMLTVRFNQDMQEASAEDVANYAISGGGAVTVISATQTTGNVVRLEVSELSPGITYTLTLNNLYSTIGMKIYPNTTKDFAYVDGSNMHLRFDFGSATNTTPGNWNNVTYYGGDLVVTNAIDIYGVSRNIGLRFTPVTAINSNAVSTGSIASNLYPASAQRDCVYSTRKFSYQIEGADPAAEYRLTFFASKSAATRETLYTAGTSNAVLDCAYNSNRVAVIEGVKPDINGNIVFSVNTNDVNSSGFCYLSVLEIQDTTPPVLRNIETSTGALDITEGTVSNIQVRLTSQPASNVTVSVNASGYAHVQVLSESAFVYFSTTNWDVWQPVYVEALSDADTSNGTATIQFDDAGGIYGSTNVYATQIDTTVPAAAARFTAAPTSGWAPLAVSFNDTSTISGVTNRFWNFGDGTVTNTAATNVTHTYTSGGTWTVQLIVTGSGESGTNTQADLISVAVPVPPSAGFTVSASSGTVPLNVTFTDVSTGDITNRFWDFGDGFTTNTTATNVTHTYTVDGAYTVELTAAGPGGADTSTQTEAVTVTLPPAPVAGFSAAPASGTAPLPVLFTDTSTGNITNRFWDFGDGVTTNITATGISHIYTVPGTNTVRLIVSGPGGADTNTQAALISVSAGAAGTLLFYDDFSSAEGSLLGTMPDTGLTAWNYKTNSPAGDAYKVIAAGLTAPDGFAPAGGGTAAKLASGNDSYATFTAVPAVAGNTVYYSFLFSATSTVASASAGGRVVGLGTAYGSDYAQTRYQKVANDNFFTLGITVRGTSGAYMLTNQLAMGSTHLIVMSYTYIAGITNDLISMWLDPDSSTFGAGTAPAANLTVATLTTDSGAIDSIRLGGQSTTPSAVMSDELRVGTSWANVTPSAEAPAPKNIETSTNALDITEGTTNSFQVRLSSQPDASVTVSVSRVSGETNIQVLAESVSAVFETTNWNVWQSIYVGALVDADTNNGTATITCADAGGVYTSTDVTAAQIDTVVISDDADSDGIPDEWEIQHFGGSTNANPDAIAANGINTIYETYIAGLNPTNPASHFALSSRQTASQQVLQWSAVSGRVCSVYWTTNLISGFQALETNIVWPQNSWTDTVHGAQSKGFYRIKIRLEQ